jgi:hypothetical protein
MLIRALPDFLVVMAMKNGAVTETSLTSARFASLPSREWSPS